VCWTVLNLGYIQAKIFFLVFYYFKSVKSKWTGFHLHFFEEGGIRLREEIPFITAQGRARVEEVDTQVCVVSLH